MNALTIAVIACMALAASAKPSGHGVIVAGPAGVVTGHGPIGPVGSYGGYAGYGAHDDGQWHGEGLLESQYHGEGAGYGVGYGAGYGAGYAGLGHVGAVVAPGATIIGPSAHATVSGPAPFAAAPLLGAGLGLGLGLGHGVLAGVAPGGVYASGHGAHVVGPHTAPATISGPAGHISASGLWGPTHAGLVGHGHHGHW